MKIRIGVGLGTRTATGGRSDFLALCDALEQRGFDSLWLSERITGPAPDPLVALALAAGRTERLKLGTSVLILPGRNPVVLAKAMASLDVLSGGRFLPAVGLGAVDPAEQAAFGVAREARGRRFDEALTVLRACWSGETVEHEGEHHTVHGVTVAPRPLQDPLDVWLGGLAPSELRRCGRLGDGWLPSFCDADDVAAGIPVVRAAAADAGRTIDPEHWGALVAYSADPLPDPVLQLLGRRRPDRRPEDLVPQGLDALRRRLEELIDAGASKFVVLPIIEPPSWDAELGALADAVLPLQT